jgi:hypothetical protein
MAGDFCTICNSELIHHEKPEKIRCSICKNVFESYKKCINGHSICDTCNGLDTLDYIEEFCKNNTSTNPIELAESIMNSPKIMMHGPEHHFLVPAVLMTTYYNKIGKTDIISRKIEIARKRSKYIHGGFCGVYGACGAGIGTGIFLSIILNCTPFSKSAWRLCGLMTSKSLNEIAIDEGPRCCKRVTYHSLKTAINFLEEFFKEKLDYSEIKCSYYERNKECIGDLCKYHPEA